MSNSGNRSHRARLIRVRTGFYLRFVSVTLTCFTLVPVSSGRALSDTVRHDHHSLDHALLLAIHGVDAPALAATMYAADAAAYPIFYGAVPVAWAGSLVLGSIRDRRNAYLLTLAFTGGYLTSTVLKNVIRRPRPALTTADARIRSERQQALEDERFEFSMPSGHATLAFGLATSISLSHSYWYVWAPTMTWATATAVSRVWRGRHYPGDILVGALLGGAIAVVVHASRDVLTPAGLRPGHGETGVPLTVTFQL